MPVAVRVNRVGTDDFRADLETVVPLLAAGLVDAVRLPKVESAGEVAVAWAATSRAQPEPHLVPLLESALGVRAANEIAPKVRLQGTLESDSPEKVAFLRAHSQLTSSLANADFEVVELRSGGPASAAAPSLTIPPPQSEASVQRSGSRGPVATIIETDEDGLLNRHSVPNTKMLNEAVR